MLRLLESVGERRTRRCTEWRPRNAARQFESHGGAAIRELIVGQRTMALDNAKLVSTVGMLVQHLAEKKYDELAALTDTIRLRSEEITEAVASYPGSILPTVRPQDIDAIKIETAAEDCWSVNVRLHTDREGPSDLTMSLTLIESDTEFYGVELEDIHVL